MILGFILGFIFSTIGWVILGKKVIEKLAKHDAYAMAIYDPEKRLWRVRGRFLCIAEKIKASIDGTSDDKVKYVD